MVSCGTINLGKDWRTASRESSGLAPDPAQVPEALVQVYAARAFNWRGIFAVHTWISTKPANSKVFKVHEVVGWRQWRGLPVVVSRPEIPDRFWYGNRPEVIGELRGEAAAQAITGIERAAKTYPYPDTYTVWPGPNSNTFTAHVVREVPELQIDLPPTAIGKDYLTNGGVVARAPSGTGYQLSLKGLLSVMAAWDEGLELNVLGLSFGVDALTPALKVPGVGRLGWGGFG